MSMRGGTYGFRADGDVNQQPAAEARSLSGVRLPGVSTGMTNLTDDDIKAIRERLVHGKARNWTTTYPPELAGWADFVTHAPTDISRLLAELDRLRALELERSEQLTEAQGLGQAFDAAPRKGTVK